MINTIVSHTLEVIFGLFLISVLANFLLGIDVMGAFGENFVSAPSFFLFNTNPLRWASC